MRVPAYHPDTPEVRRDWAQYYDKVTEMDAQAGQRLGEVQPRVGDVDGDNKPDLVLGIPRANRVVVVFGGLDLDANGIRDLVEHPSPVANPWTVTSLVNAGLAVSNGVG